MHSNESEAQRCEEEEEEEEIDQEQGRGSKISITKTSSDMKGSRSSNTNACCQSSHGTNMSSRRGGERDVNM
jgi:hypothetical protein